MKDIQVIIIRIEEIHNFTVDRSGYYSHRRGYWYRHLDNSNDVTAVMGWPDDLKSESSMTLFAGSQLYSEA